MKYAITALSAAMMVGVAVADEIYDCALPCLSTLATAGAAVGCTEADIACFCAKDDLLITFRDCVYGACETDHKREESIEYGLHMCEEVGVTVTINPVPSTAVSSPAATGDHGHEEEEEHEDDCAEHCLYELVEAGEAVGCTEEDVACFCNNEALLVSLRTCAYAECNDHEAGELIEYGLGLCSEVGVTVTVPTGNPAATETSDPTDHDDHEEEEEHEDDCAEHCLYELVEAGEAVGCTEEDVACFCNNETLLVSLRTCAYAECSDHEAGELIEYGLGLCSEVGVTVTVPTGNPAEASDSAETSAVAVAGGSKAATPVALAAVAGFAAMLF